MSIKIDVEMCSACGECVKACPMEAITLKGVTLEINEDECTECGSCESECPNGALKLE